MSWFYSYHNYDCLLYKNYKNFLQEFVDVNRFESVKKIDSFTFDV